MAGLATDRALTFPVGCDRMRDDKIEKKGHEGDKRSVLSAAESRRLVEAGAGRRCRIPPEPRAQRSVALPVSLAGPPPLPGRVLLDTEWVV